MVRILKHIFRIITFLSFIAIIYFFISLLLSFVPVNSHFNSSEGTILIYVRSNGVHTDIFLPVKSSFIDWNKKIPYSSVMRADSTFKWIGFGWGNREFYIETKEWEDLDILTALRAGCGIGKSVIHIEFVKTPGTTDNWHEIKVTPQNIKKLIDYIYSSFETDLAGNFILIHGAHYYSNDAFFEAKGRFTIFKTCNEWTGDGLRKSGIRMGVWTPFEKSIVWNLKYLKTGYDCGLLETD